MAKNYDKDTINTGTSGHYSSVLTYLEQNMIQNRKEAYLAILHSDFKKYTVRGIHYRAGIREINQVVRDEEDPESVQSYTT